MNGSDRKRGYRSDRRREQAAETRARILTAAGSLFVEQGFAGTTIEAVAREAAVATPTVYAAFRNKPQLLAEAVRYAVRGDATGEPLLSQAEPQAVRAETDQRAQLRRFAVDVTERLERVGPLLEVVGVAARQEPELAALRERLQRGRLENHRTLIGWLAANGPLRPGLTAAAAAELSWTLASPEVHRLLRRDRGWSRRRFAGWLHESLERLLLPD